jgi:MerR family copper efflux transcriptional regulator
MGHLLIGDVAERTGLSAPTIRYYESIGLLTRPTRSPTGYRPYSAANLEELGFIKKAQSLGFSLEEIAEILKLSRQGATPCAHVLELARRHLAAVSERIDQLTRFREQLAGEISKWDGQGQPSCAGLCTIIVNSTVNGAEHERPTGDARRRRFDHERALHTEARATNPDIHDRRSAVSPSRSRSHR